MKMTWFARIRQFVMGDRTAHDRSAQSGTLPRLKSATVRVRSASFGRRAIRPVRTWDRLTHA
jgi:hypothetical protein